MNEAESREEGPVPLSTSIVVPLRQEERRVGRAVGVLQGFADRNPHLGDLLEVVFVDSGSTDRTVETLLSLVPSLSFSTRVLAARHGGKGETIAKGVASCTKEIIGFSDVDFSASPNALFGVWEAFAGGAAAVIGSRSLGRRPGTIRRPLGRGLAGGSFNAFVRALRLTDLSDTQCGFKFFRADLARSIFADLSLGGFSFDLEVLNRLEQAGALIHELPVEWSHDGDSRVRLATDGPRMLRDALRLRLGLLPPPAPAGRFREERGPVRLFVEET